MDNDMPDFGECCWCGSTEKVRTIVVFEYETPGGLCGWSCVQCGLPEKGASAVACDACCDAKRPAHEDPRWLAGRPITQRLPVPAFEDRVPFVHNARFHPELSRLN